MNKEKSIKEKIEIEKTSTKEENIIRFLGGKLSIYILIVIILLFTAIWLYSQINVIMAPLIIVINSLLVPVLVAYIFFYMLNPVYNLLLAKTKINSGMASILSIIFGIAVILTVFIGAVPVMIEQTQHLITSMPGYVNIIRNYLEANADNAIVKNIIVYINENLNGTQLSAAAFDIFTNFISNAASILSSTAAIIITTPFVLYYLLKDSSRFKIYIISKLPEKSKEPIETTINEIDNKVGSYISGQMLVSVCVGILLFVGYQIIGLQYAVSLATLAGVLSIVPYLGPMMAIIPAMLVAFGTDWVMVLKMLVVWGVVQFLEGNFISPNIMGRSMKQHPLTVIFVVIIGTNMMGILGAVIGIPVYAILKILLEKLILVIKNRYKRIYKGE
ncbi:MULTISPECIES: AI-2E family transporter [unclassified Gemella]|uniref:AI-2E family transporter n=1 Tax=unclassified Gemella TaxID=2624949 RepID=UPI001C04D969|nr:MULTISPECIES: AI-2E family transporter [unclassified Gemella]MBU0278960.1 AI-2E family transporter [Gemella sp. zg-1178]QWQ39068.1 AI-2E family transporter [Gemella sp. zg-570]